MLQAGRRETTVFVLNHCGLLGIKNDKKEKEEIPLENSSFCPIVQKSDKLSNGIRSR